MLKRAMVFDFLGWPSEVNCATLAEALVYHDEVILLVSEASLTAFLMRADLDGILALQDEGFLRIVCQVGHNAYPGLPVALTDVARRFDVAPDWSVRSPEEAGADLIDQLAKQSQLVSRRPKSDIVHSLKASIHWVTGALNEAQLIQLHQRLVTDHQFVRHATKAFFHGMLPWYAPTGDYPQFHLRLGTGGPTSLEIESNIPATDFPIQWKDIGVKAPRDSTFSLICVEQHFLCFLNLAASYLLAAAREDAGLALDPAVEAIFEGALHQSCGANYPAPAISHFEELVFGASPAVGMAIESRAKTFSDVCQLLRTRRARITWPIPGAPDNLDLIRSYIDEISRTTWLERLPAKLVRFGMFTGAGIAADALFTGGLGTAVGVATGIVDAFLVDRVVPRWRPDKFVNGPLREFIGDSTGLEESYRARRAQSFDNLSPMARQAIAMGNHFDFGDKLMSEMDDS